MKGDVGWRSILFVFSGFGGEGLIDMRDGDLRCEVFRDRIV